MDEMCFGNCLITVTVSFKKCMASLKNIGSFVILIVPAAFFLLITLYLIVNNLLEFFFPGIGSGSVQDVNCGRVILFEGAVCTFRAKQKWLH